jgi:hypothetical protein
LLQNDVALIAGQARSGLQTHPGDDDVIQWMQADGGFV